MHNINLVYCWSNRNGYLAEVNTKMFFGTPCLKTHLLPQLLQRPYLPEPSKRLRSDRQVFQVVVFQKVLARVVVPAEYIYFIAQRLIMLTPLMGETLVTGINGKTDYALAFMDPHFVVGPDIPSFNSQERSPAMKSKLVSRPHDR